MVHTVVFSSLNEPFWKQANKWLSQKKTPEKLSYFKTARASDNTKDKTMLVIILYTTTEHWIQTMLFETTKGLRIQPIFKLPLWQTTRDTINQITQEA